MKASDTHRRSSVLLILPCSGKKDGIGEQAAGTSILDLLPSELRRGLQHSRERVKAITRFDSSPPVPAWQRYSGELYASSRPALGDAVRAGQNVVIISGGYGLLLATEGIHKYDRTFRLSDWPDGLLQDCLLAVAKATCCSSALAFCAKTTSYATLIRRTRWRDAGLRAAANVPDMAGRRSAIVLGPRAMGQALAAYLCGQPFQESVDGIRMQVEQLT